MGAFVWSLFHSSQVYVFFECRLVSGGVTERVKGYNHVVNLIPCTRGEAEITQ